MDIIEALLEATVILCGPELSPFSLLSNVNQLCNQTFLRLQYHKTLRRRAFDCPLVHPNHIFGEDAQILLFLCTRAVGHYMKEGLMMFTRRRESGF